MTKDERQEIARVKWIKNKCKGTFVWPTGTGKTYAALKCLKSVINKYPELKFMVVVPTTNLKDQWLQQIDNWELQFNGDVIIINSAVRSRYTTDILVLDELHSYGSSVFSMIFEKVKYRYILGLTATFERLDGKHVLLARYCPVIDTITTQEAIMNNWISSFVEYEVLLDVDDIWEYKKSHRKFISHFEFFGYSFDLAMSCIGKEGFKNRKQLAKQMCRSNDKEEINKTLKTITYHSTQFMKCLQNRKKFINYHPKKLEIARKIIEARPKSKILTFSNNVKMAEQIGGEVYTGKDSKTKARASLEEFDKKQYGVLNSVKKLIVGADIANLDVAIMLGIDSSKTRATQSRGRVVRYQEGKKAEIFNLIIKDTVEEKWFRNSHSDGNYYTIDEKGLEMVLKNKIPEEYKKPIKDFTFRY